MMGVAPRGSKWTSDEDKRLLKIVRPESRGCSSQRTSSDLRKALASVLGTFCVRQLAALIRDLEEQLRGSPPTHCGARIATSHQKPCMGNRLSPNQR
jgi:hypothetical protein